MFTYVTKRLKIHRFLTSYILVIIKKMKFNDKYQIKEDKLKPLQPTLRTKKRFIKIKIESKKQFDFKQISDKLCDELLFYIGAIDYSKAGIWLLKDKFNQQKQELVIKATTQYKDKVIAALTLIDEIDNTTTKISITKVSGTLKGLQKE